MIMPMRNIVAANMKLWPGKTRAIPVAEKHTWINAKKITTSMTLYTDCLYGLVIAVNIITGIKNIPQATTKKKAPCVNAKTARTVILKNK